MSLNPINEKTLTLLLLNMFFIYLSLHNADVWSFLRWEFLEYPTSIPLKTYSLYSMEQREKDVGDLFTATCEA